MYSAKEKIFWFSLISRIAILFMQLIFNTVFPDHKADAFISPEDPNEKFSFLDTIIIFLFRGLTRWDAQYYIHIAKYGYTYENTLAFLPLFPKLLKYFSEALNLGLNYSFSYTRISLNYTSTIVIVGIIINLFCFVKAAQILYDLSVKIFKNTKFAYRATILFCINPASIFFTALYTESLFVYLTFYSMLESISNNPCVFLPVSLSSLVRSNGLVNIGFPIYTWFKNFLMISIPNYILENRHYHTNKRSLMFNSRHIFLSLLQLISQIIFCLLPFGLLQVYNYNLFCNLELNATTLPYHLEQFAIEKDLLVPGKVESSWCNKKLPMSYSYVQHKYWNVGFFKYWQMKQIPNFILALPILYLFIECIIKFINQHKSKFQTFEFFTEVVNTNTANNDIYPLKMFVFVVHGLFLTLFCIFFVHIQVSTRLLCSASPLLYWYCAIITFEEEKVSKEIKEIEYESNENLFSKWKVFFLTKKKFTFTEKLIYGYFLGYCVVGCFMFSNFLPWT